MYRKQKQKLQFVLISRTLFYIKQFQDELIDISQWIDEDGHLRTYEFDSISTILLTNVMNKILE